MRAHALLLAAATLAAATLTGCLDVHHGRPHEGGTRAVKTRGPLDAPRAVRWRQVDLGQPPKTRQLGYVRTQPTAYGEIHWVYDPVFVLIGRVSPNGETHRVGLDGRETRVGDFALHHALLALFGQERERPITLSHLPDPRG